MSAVPSHRALLAPERARLAQSPREASRLPRSKCAIFPGLGLLGCHLRRADDHENCVRAPPCIERHRLHNAALSSAQPRKVEIPIRVASARCPCRRFFLPSLVRAQVPEANPVSLDSLRHTLLTTGDRLSPVQREAWLRSLETLVLKPPYDKNPATVRHYRMMCDRAIAEIEQQTGKTAGVMIWKFYSSGYVCRSGRAVFAFDLNQGVNAKRWTPTGAPVWTPPPKTDTDFVLTDAQIARLARLIDVAFYSHQDEDHVCHAFMAALVRAGKQVVVPKPVVSLPGYADLADRLTVLRPEIGKTYAFGALQVEGLATRQAYQNAQRKPVENNIYLVKTPTQLVVMHKGDANIGDEAWDYFAA